VTFWDGGLGDGGEEGELMKAKGSTMVPLDAIDPRTLGQRIAQARKARGVTQEAAAAFLGCSRPTYIAIERGDRSAKADEIVKLASHFGRQVHELVRPGQTVIDLQSHLRAVAERMHEHDRDELLAAIDELQRFARFPTGTCSWRLVPTSGMRSAIAN